MKNMKMVEVILLSFCLAGILKGQSEPKRIQPVSDVIVQAPEVSLYQMRQYLMSRVEPSSVPPTAAQWTQEATRIRKHLLEDVLFHGWPKEWIESRVKMEEVGVVETGHGYRIRKLRYEVLPGHYSVAILYEPHELRGKVPAIIDVHGHVGTEGKAIEYKQKICINQAKRGMLALSLEYLNHGELSHPENDHYFGGHLDLVGTNMGGLFYLSILKGLDYLWDHPNVDRTRLGITGMSGGGWQTLLLGTLDERIKVAVPVSGYGTLATQLARAADVSDLEINVTDLRKGLTGLSLPAVRAPRPTLLIYAAEDDCCWRAPLVKPHVYGGAKPFFDLFGQGLLAWHENTDRFDHNYGRDNRIQAYRFFSKHFGLPLVEDEVAVDAELKDFDELKVGLPNDNLTILGLARVLAKQIQLQPPPAAGPDRHAWASESRARLRDLLRYSPVTMKHPWAIGNTRINEFETRTYRFEMSNGLSATGIWLKATGVPENAPISILLHDAGKKENRVLISDRVNRGEQVLALDLVFMGDVSPGWQYAQLVANIGERPLGLEAAQLIGLTRWLQESSETRRARIFATGIRSQVIALAAAALSPDQFSQIEVREGMPSLRHLLDAPVPYRAAPDLFCLDLLRQFDIDHLIALGGKTVTSRTK